MTLKHFWFICFVITNINIATQKFDGKIADATVCEPVQYSKVILFHLG